MLKDLYIVNENGQMEMNFDALECVTDYHFARFIQGIMPERELKEVQVEEFDVYVTVTAQQGRIVSIHHFDRFQKTKRSMHYTKGDLEKMLSYIGGENA